MIGNIGAKFLGRSIFLWGEEDQLEALLALAAPAEQLVHELDASVVMQAGIFEIVTTKLNTIPIPAWVFEEFDLAVETRNFRYKDMIYPEYLDEPWTNPDYWYSGASVPDMSRTETRLWFFFLAARYIDAGYEALHFRQINARRHQTASIRKKPSNRSGINIR